MNLNDWDIYEAYIDNCGGKKRGQSSRVEKERVRDPKQASKTFEGIALAMAEQWGEKQSEAIDNEKKS